MVGWIGARVEGLESGGRMDAAVGVFSGWLIVPLSCSVDVGLTGEATGRPVEGLLAELIGWPVAGLLVVFVVGDSVM